MVLVRHAPLAREPPAQWLVATDRWGNPAYRLLSLPDSQDPAPTWQVRPLGAKLGPSRGTAEVEYATQMQQPWGHSSAGRARRSHRRGQEFDPPWLHHYSVRKGARKAGGPAITGLSAFFVVRASAARHVAASETVGTYFGAPAPCPQNRCPHSPISLLGARSRAAKPRSCSTAVVSTSRSHLQVAVGGD